MNNRIWVLLISGIPLNWDTDVQELIKFVNSTKPKDAQPYSWHNHMNARWECSDGSIIIWSEPLSYRKLEIIG